MRKMTVLLIALLAVAILPLAGCYQKRGSSKGRVSGVPEKGFRDASEIQDDRTQKNLRDKYEEEQGESYSGDGH